ncbi:hypothetical protein HIM_11934 [Hirsutella minnesotensis 3608]|uniref:Nineteen complex-related protein 2 domain-containing protein n=1 Tax=Hirsutella minnesotensis 3608 TaxID=1043627 RepID=A0A0F7ZQY6_9HYPO|nr:hypothetical protein HIM_11934 [Hirsutella minnesotensis 3608]
MDATEPAEEMQMPRKDSVADEQTDDSKSPTPKSTTTTGEPSKPLFGSRSGRKPFRQSGLRKSLKQPESGLDEDGDGDKDDDNGAPVVIRPRVSRLGSLKQKKKTSKPKLSFGADTADSDDGPGDDFSTPQKSTLNRKAVETSATKRGMALRGLPDRFAQDAEERPRYSKEYLSELQSSTPSTPRDISTLHIADADEMELDASELEGALIVDSPATSNVETSTRIMTDAEIREKKERRARLAKENEFLSVEDDDEEEGGRKKKDDTRLLAEDEELGEGFDDFVEDGGLSLGRRAEKERRKRERQQMAELISAAEGHSSDSSSDSDAERRIAYESAQTKAGLDGLKKPKKNPAGEQPQVPSRITPLPALSGCLARLQATLKLMESDIRTKHARVEELRREREEIAKREVEVQALLDQTGKKYQEAMEKGKSEGLKVHADGRNSELAAERGLESLGTTPRRPHGEDEDVDMADGE